MQISDFEFYPNKQVFFNAYVDSKPDTFPATSNDIDELPDGYVFRVGSWIYVVNIHELFMWNGSQFVSQKEG